SPHLHVAGTIAAPGRIGPPTRSIMPSCSQPSRTLRAAEAVARRRAILDRRCARRHIARAGRDGRMVPIEQMDWTEEDRASKLAQHHPLDSTKRLLLEKAVIAPKPSNMSGRNRL